MPRMPETPKRKPMHARRHKEPRYNTTQWRRYRKAYLAEHPLCVMCKAIATTTLRQCAWAETSGGQAITKRCAAHVTTARAAARVTHR